MKIQTYIAKTGGGQCEAVRLNDELANDAKALKEFPQGFKISNRVGSSRKKFQFRGQDGNAGDWFIVEPAPGNGHFLDHESFTAQFYESPAPEVQPPTFEERVAPAVAFERAISSVLDAHLRSGLTVTEAVGTLNLCATDIQLQFLQNTRNDGGH